MMPNREKAKLTASAEELIYAIFGVGPMECDDDELRQIYLGLAKVSMMFFRGRERVVKSFSDVECEDALLRLLYRLLSRLCFNLELAEGGNVDGFRHRRVLDFLRLHRNTLEILIK